MGLKLLTDGGNMAWQCPRHGPMDAHLSHSLVKFVYDGSIELPPCPQCGWKLTLRTVRFAHEPNAVDAQGNLTETHYMLERHSKLAGMMRDAGKVVPPPPADMVILSHTVETLPDGTERITIVHQPVVPPG